MCMREREREKKERKKEIKKFINISLIFFKTIYY